MNKKLKIAAVAVSVVMAGTMAFGIFGCGDGGKKVEITNPKLDGEKLTYAEGTEINVNICDSGNEDRQIAYASKQIASSWKSFDGKTYVTGSLKPAWQTFSDKLGIKFNNTGKTGRKSEELSKAISEGDVDQHNFINASASEIMQNTSYLLDINKYLDYMPNYKAFLEQSPVVQLSLTMDSTGAMYYIPYFDGNDDIEKYELAQRNWVKTILNTDVAGTTTYADQYKEKNRVVDKDGNVSYPKTFAQTSVTAHMGKVAADNWVVETTKPSNTAETVYVCCNYGKVIEALKDANSALRKAVAKAEAISGWDATKAGTLDASGNIVDITNYVINGTTGKVTGAILAEILREYVKVAYYVGDTADGAKASSDPMYTAGNLADVFISASGAWDADLMTGLFRCVVTNVQEFDGMSKADIGVIYALAGRENKAQRQNDLIALAGELYGVRGLESRLEYTYIDHAGNLADARLNEESYDAAAKLSALAAEGLLYTGADKSEKYYTAGKADKDGKITGGSKMVTFMMHDYAQTQTTDGFKNMGLKYTKTGGTEQKLDKSEVVAAKYDFAPIVTPVSKWDTDGNTQNGKETVMRFTESWRSVKNSGVCIPKGSIKSEDQLSAILSFIDYLYSNDGQLVGSFGSQATGADAKDGCWYGTPVNATLGGVTVTNGEGDLAKLQTAGVVATNDGKQYYIANTKANAANRAQYFMFGNKIYSGMPYKDRNIPKLTNLNINFYYGFDVDVAGKMDTNNSTGYKMNHAGKYTDYARGVIGAALPVGNKDQGFEYQCTAKSGLEGAAIVSTALNNGTIKHVTQQIDKNNWWYTEAVSFLPISVQESSIIKNQTYLDGSGKLVGIYNPTSTAGYSNVFVDLAFHGYKTEIKIGTCGKTSGDYAMQADAAKLVSYIKGLNNGGLESRTGYYTTAWNTLKTIYNNKTK